MTVMYTVYNTPFLLLCRNIFLNLKCQPHCGTGGNVKGSTKTVRVHLLGTLPIFTLEAETFLRKSGNFDSLEMSECCLTERDVWLHIN